MESRCRVEIKEADARHRDTIKKQRSGAMRSRVWEGAMELTKRGYEPSLWASQISSALALADASLPSPELAELLVSHICWDNNVPATWKLLETALLSNLVPPLLVLALLSTRVIPGRWLHPETYRLFMELLKRHSFSFASLFSCPKFTKIMISVEEVLDLSSIFAHKTSEPGALLVEFVFSVVWQLLDASLDDDGLMEVGQEKKPGWAIGTKYMEIDCKDITKRKSIEHRDLMNQNNTVLAVEIIGEYFKNKVTSRILYLARQNMSSHWECFIKRVQLLAEKSSAIRRSKNITPETLLQLTLENHNVLSGECKTSLHKHIHVLSSGSPASSTLHCHGISQSDLWVPFDLFFEDTMDGSRVAASSAVEILAGLVKALQAVNRATWEDTFLGLWVAALRLVQRERNPSEGPVPHLDTYVCMLLSITTLAILYVIEEEEVISKAQCPTTGQRKEMHFGGKRHRGFVSSVQQLHDFEGLLNPPLSIASIANQAALKAVLFLSGVTNTGYFDGVSTNDMPTNCSGNLRHLIVEACIARNLLNTSAYLWPGYVKNHINQLPRGVSGHLPGWLSLMNGSPLTPALVNALVSTPASSLAEIERIYEIAVSGSSDDKFSAAMILCGATLIRGWNVQEHTILLITKLLSPPVPAEYSRSESHLIDCAPFLNVLLEGISSADCVQIFSLLGVVPQLAGKLLPICEVFGSCAPKVCWTLPSGGDISSHIVFSSAFTLLLKLWRFDRPPIEHVMGDVSPIGTVPTPEYLLLVRNSQLTSYATASMYQNEVKRMSKFSTPSSTEPMFIDLFPNLKRWYMDHQKCIASTLSGLTHGSSVHQIVDAVLDMMFQKVNRGGPPLSTSSRPAKDESFLRLKLPAWDILEAIPFVLDASLTACAYGNLSPRELTTGLKALADFLPASMATIVSYLSAEVTRGIWKPAPMNGTDWPSPATNLPFVEQQIKKILAATGVDVPSLDAGKNSPAVLPLPLAALVSLTITYKLNMATERFLFLIGPALDTLASGCPWPCWPIIASLWALKVKRWTDFLIFSASRTVFHHSSDAVHQLLQRCFSCTVGLNSGSSVSGGVGSLLGHGLQAHFTGGYSPVAPGILYLRVYRHARNVMFMAEEIVILIMQSINEIVTCGLHKTKSQLKYGQVSLSSSMARAKLSAMLGGSLIWITGGLNLVQSLIKETLPSWFLSGHKFGLNGGSSVGTVSMLRGCALAYLVVVSGAFAWGVDKSSPEAVKWRRHIIGHHLNFIASALCGTINVGCDSTLWRAYVSGLVRLLLDCTPLWLVEVDVDILERLSKGLIRLNEEELALSLLGIGGESTMSAAVELIVRSDF